MHFLLSIAFTAHLASSEPLNWFTVTRKTARCGNPSLLNSVILDECKQDKEKQLYALLVKAVNQTVIALLIFVTSNFVSRVLRILRPQQLIQQQLPLLIQLLQVLVLLLLLNGILLLSLREQLYSALLGKDLSLMATTMEKLCRVIT